MAEPGPEQVTLIDESGAPREFLLHDAFDVDEATYFLVESADDPEVVMLLKQTETGLHSVEGAEFDRVVARLEAEDAGEGA